MTQRPFGLKPTLALIVGATLALAGSACKGFTDVPASLYTLTDTEVVYPINRAAPNQPTALYIYSGQVVAADANFLFDVAFDLDSVGNIIVLPQAAVASGLAPTHTVGVQAVSGSFDALNEAPDKGYRADTALVVKPTQVVMVQSQDANACSTSISGTVVYAKFVIDSVNASTGAMSMRFATDPNCGFRSFEPGLPKN